MVDESVPLLDLKRQYISIKSEIDAAVERVISSQRFVLGPEVEAMEQLVAEYCGVRHCIGLSSGSDALIVMLMALGVGPGDEVITTPYSFFATAGSIARLGARPVFVDIDPSTYNMDPNKIEAAITPRTKVIMPVHLFGQCADMTAIQFIALQHGLTILEDAAQAIGAEHRGQRAGSLGLAAGLSFFPSKNLGAFGDGGAVTTDDPQFARQIRCLRMHGGESEYYHRVVGGNFRIDALQAAVLAVKIKHLDNWSAARRANADYYTQAFAAAGLGEMVVTPVTESMNHHVFNQYVIRVKFRDELRNYLTAKNIGNKVYYPVPLHLQECFADLGHRVGDFPHSEQAALETVALPIYPELSTRQLDQVVSIITSYYRSVGSTSVRAA